MERDNLDRAIEQKLHNYSAEPPAQLWDDIESDLAGLQPIASVQSHTIRLRRNIIRYAIVASLLVAAVTFGFLHDTEPLTIATLIDEVEKSKNIATQPEVESEPESTQIAAVTNIKKREQITINHTDICTDEITIHDKKADNSKSEPSQPKSQQKSEQKSAQKPKTSQWSDPKDWPNPNETKIKRKTISLNTANMGVGSSDVSAESLTRYGASEFSVRELSSTSGLAAPTSIEYNPESLKHRAPLSVGISFSWGISKRLDIETGLTYTYLKSDAQTDTKLFSYKQTQELHYLGIPVSLKYNVIDRKQWGVYARGGAMIERGIKGKFSTKIIQNGGGPDGKESYDIGINGVQSSISIGAGAEFKFTDIFGIYLEPSANYYFKNKAQPLSYRTENPLHFGLKAGIRVNFR